MRNWIHSWLGISMLEADIDKVNNNVLNLRDELLDPLNTLASVLMTEDNQAREVFSNRIGKRAEKKLVAEHLARMHTEGKV